MCSIVGILVFHFLSAVNALSLHHISWSEVVFALTYIANLGVLVLGQMHLAKGALTNDTLEDVLLQLLVALGVLGEGGVQGLFDFDMASELHGAPARCRGGCGQCGESGAQ